ncbi:glycosyl transferase family protein [Lineolata rhizophorae]|uniref:Glycosyl transferase family protein n=1 Tax=Lineolata rhizophorae TaxID=578093 RepID=A0A6A6NMN8_9PEZI|nr:glycosyl transferase family protein [Lineolata rhizophorae]
MAPNADPTAGERVVESKKVWTTLITNTAYLSGLLTLEYSLRRAGSAYPLVALYTDGFPAAGHAALAARGIPRQRVAYLLPATPKDFSRDPRFYDCWSKLTPFSLTAYDRVVQLDSDMLVRRNMDELMELALDAGADAADGKATRAFAASHACVCNPLGKPHYPRDWVPANCAFTMQHGEPERAQAEGAPPTAGLAMPNGGLQVVNPSREVYDAIVERLGQATSTAGYEFADQSLLADLFPGRWVALPYVYNALKTLRYDYVHAPIWRDECVKNVHYILAPKPWDERPGETTEVPHEWWWDMTLERRKAEKDRGIDDGW